MDKILEQSISQLLALVTFFAFPAIQYLLLKWAARREGLPRLGYLPEYGFRLAIRNIPRRRFLKEIKYKVFLRSLVPPSRGSTAYTFYDTDIVCREEFFVFPNSDLTMLSFQLHGDEEENINFVVTDKLGNKIQNGIPLNKVEKLICDYSATIDNFFNFDIKVEKRVVIEYSSLVKMWNETHLGCETFKAFEVDYILNPGH
ncbi:hypothetical protein LC605_30685 [Nostoc sp. CHAB 5836]|uniref:hypothetical protein n=1 Tax=Nostoc sp. CHAB 5836 TaxID=2780404 RepID=UPI001E30ECE1|nr:hypothetical protein [Nostoc sp. CHAB 5836]MCC5619357.1 hypothetical protein [Nostoc sp. CHAB 5836]